ncbi:hypothetical protein Cgig2_031331 [Carnegiea gigantea]|uniref:Nudix hydrolase domain-containing protein n=1 Tax=Carnegiea gigantea TaxID=171969 RepID=A0A9Q1JKL5_9CARY|nr:hypothetical protein Cgig2_031331 [Carnegiea gigantea]
MYEPMTWYAFPIKCIRRDVHRDGDYHRAVHVWIYSESTHELLLQKRADCKDSWPGQWDISSAGHISAGESSLVTARRELHEELGVDLSKDAFELLFVFLQEWFKCIDLMIEESISVVLVINDGTYINNEFNDVYLVTTISPIPLEAYTLQETEVSAVKYISCEEYKSLLEKADPGYVPYDINGHYGQLFEMIAQRYKENAEERSLALQRQLNRYAPIRLSADLSPGNNMRSKLKRVCLWLCAQLSELGDSDLEALKLILKSAVIIDDVFHEQVWGFRVTIIQMSTFAGRKCFAIGHANA